MIRCPKCKSNLSVPDREDPEIVVRCPRCRTEVKLYEIPEQGSDLGGAESTGFDRRESSPRVESDQKSKIVRRRYYSRTRLPKNAPPKKIRRRRRKRKTKLTRGDFAKIVLGGLMAFPVAQLIIWWGFAKDPFYLGPKVASAVPFVVPRPFRGESQIPAEESPKYVAHPESSLIQGRPFDFNRLPAKANAGSIQRGMPRQFGSPSQEKLKSLPAGSSDDGNQ